MFKIRGDQIGSMRRQRLGDSFIDGFAGTKQTAAWDASAENIFVTDPLGHKTSLSFDHNGFPARLVTPTGRNFDFRNNSVGQPQEFMTPSELLVEVEYDDKQRLGRIVRMETLSCSGIRLHHATTVECRRQLGRIQLDYASPHHLAGSRIGWDDESVWNMERARK